MPHRITANSCWSLPALFLRLHGLVAIVLAGLLAFAPTQSKAALVVDQCAPFEDIFSANGIRVYDVVELISVSVSLVGPNEYVTNWRKEVLSWDPIVQAPVNPFGTCLIQERYQFGAPSGPSGNYLNAGANGTASDGSLRSTTILVRRFPPNFTDVILRRGFAPNDRSLVRNRALVQGGYTLTTSSPAYETFLANPTTEQSSVPFIIEAAAPGDQLVIYANDQIVFSQDLATFGIGDLVFANLPPLLATPTDGSLVSIWIRSANQGQSRIWFPARVTIDPADTDQDGVPVPTDLCPNTAADATVDGDGCSADQRDADRDGVSDSRDLCPATALGSPVDANGCSALQLDADADGVPNAVDACPGTASGATVDSRGCSSAQRDTDGDGVNDALDQCPNTAAGTPVNAAGCAASQLDTDGDGVPDSVDACPGTAAGTVVDARGCAVPPPPPPSAKTCDINSDASVDYRDISLILFALGKTVTGTSDPRDFNGDGRITLADAAMCTKKCTRSYCLPAK